MKTMMTRIRRQKDYSDDPRLIDWVISFLEYLALRKQLRNLVDIDANGYLDGLPQITHVRTHMSNF